MPQISTLPWAMVIAHASPNSEPTYYASPEDCTIVLDNIPVGGLTVFLPGPEGPHSRRPPDDGDWYIVADPLGLLGNEDVGRVTINGGGFSIKGVLTFPMPNVIYGWAGFQFVAALQAWLVVVGGVA